MTSAKNYSPPLVLRGRARVGVFAMENIARNSDPHPNPPPEYQGRGKAVAIFRNIWFAL
jgi:hypothetical protein